MKKNITIKKQSNCNPIDLIATNFPDSSQATGKLEDQPIFQYLRGINIMLIWASHPFTPMVI